jgi:hypothetical protein
VPHYKVIRSFGGFKRGETAELTAKDAKNLLDTGYVAEVTSEPKARKPRKAAPKKPPVTEAPAES